jgi:hypothetical protein
MANTGGAGGVAGTAGAAEEAGAERIGAPSAADSKDNTGRAPLAEAFASSARLAEAARSAAFSARIRRRSIAIRCRSGQYRLVSVAQRSNKESGKSCANATIGVSAAVSGRTGVSVSTPSKRARCLTPRPSVHFASSVVGCGNFFSCFEDEAAAPADAADPADTAGQCAAGAANGVVAECATGPVCARGVGWGVDGETS